MININVCNNYSIEEYHSDDRNDNDDVVMMMW